MYRIGRYVGDRYDERVMINHWDLLDNMEKLACFKVGDVVQHNTWGVVSITKRVWRFTEGRIVYHIISGTDPETHAQCYHEQLVMGEAKGTASAWTAKAQG